MYFFSGSMLMIAYLPRTACGHYYGADKEMVLLLFAIMQISSNICLKSNHLKYNLSIEHLFPVNCVFECYG